MKIHSTLITRYSGLLISLFLILIPLAMFWQVRHHDFINYDDGLYISENPHIQEGLTWEGIKWAFSADLFSDSPNADFWIPLTFFSHLLTIELFGMNPSGHHLINLLLHLLNTVLLFVILRRMTGALWPSAFVGALFAVHPLHVESVAWITERKDVLSTLFLLLTVWAYVRYTDHPRLHRYLLVVLVFTLGLMAKPMLVTLPFVLLLLDYWPLGRLPLAGLTRPRGLKALWRLVWEKIPLFALAGAFSVMTYLTLQRGVGIHALESFPLGTRISNALVSYVSYIQKMIWPRGLAVFYPHPGNALPLWQVGGASLLLVCITVLVIRVLQRRPYLAVGWLWYLGTLVPVIGLVRAGDQAIADRYTYLPLIGLFIMIAWAISDLVAQWHYRRAVLALSAGVLLSVLMVLTWRQVGHWRNSLTLFEHALQVTDENYLAHNNLGLAYYDLRRLEEALLEYQTALTFKPGYALAHNNLGLVYQDLRRFDEALKEYQTAVRHRPDNAKFHYNLGIVHADLRRFDEAILEYRMALTLKPNFAEVHNNLGIIYEKLGWLDRAIQEYQAGLKLRPDLVESHNNLGIVYRRLGRYEEAIQEYQIALKHRPDYVNAHYNLGNIYKDLRRLEEATQEYQIALTLNPNDAPAYYNLGTVFRNLGQTREALRAFERALQIQPDFLQARQALNSLVKKK